MGATAAEVSCTTSEEHQQGEVKLRLGNGCQIGGERTAGSGKVLTWFIKDESTTA